MAVHNVDGLELNVDRGPNWLFVKLRTREAPQAEVPQIADKLWSISSRHFIYRLVLGAGRFGRDAERDDGSARDAAGAAGAVRRCAADLRAVARVRRDAAQLPPGFGAARIIRRAKRR